RTSTPDTGAAQATDGGAFTTPPSTLNPLSYGAAYALITNTVTMNGQAGYEVGVELTAAAQPVDRCAGATRTSGACCFVPAAAAPDAPDAPGGLAGKNPDGGLSFVNASAGTLTFTDTSSNAALATSTYGQVPSGFGTGEGYATALINPVTWSTGDVLAVSATGESGQIPAFSASVHAVSMPDIAPPSTILHASTQVFTWTPDANAATMTVTLAAYASSTSGSGTSHGTVSCQVDDAAGALTIDPSVMQDFQAGDQCWTDLERASDQKVNVAGGHVAFAARALNEVIATIQ
ncbi:MAG: hypothetical protein ABI461_20630, partial [Polyangiaceae bacterium]